MAKAIRFLGKKGTFLKGTTKNVGSKEGGFLDFLRP